MVGELPLPIVKLSRHFIGARPLPRLLGQTPGEQRHQRSRYLTQVRLRVSHPVQQIRRLPVPERAAPRRRVHQHSGESEHIAGRVVFLSRRLFRRHERRRAHGGTRTGQPVVADGPRDTEVDDLRAVGGDEDVGRLEIAVHDVRPVQLAERRTQGGPQCPHRRLGQRSPGLDGLVERGPEYVLGRQPRRLTERIRVHHPGPEPIPDDPGRVHFEAETGTGRRIGGDARVHGLDRDGASADGTRHVDGAHAPAAQPGNEPVRAEGDRVVVGEWSRHRVLVVRGGKGERQPPGAAFPAAARPGAPV